MTEEMEELRRLAADLDDWVRDAADSRPPLCRGGVAAPEPSPGIPTPPVPLATPQASDGPAFEGFAAEPTRPPLSAAPPDVQPSRPAFSAPPEIPAATSAPAVESFPQPERPALSAAPDFNPGDQSQRPNPLPETVRPPTAVPAFESPDFGRPPLAAATEGATGLPEDVTGLGSVGDVGGGSDLAGALEDLTDEVRRLADLMERGERGAPSQAKAPERAAAGERRHQQEEDIPVARRKGSASPSVPRDRG